MLARIAWRSERAPCDIEFAEHGAFAQQDSRQTRFLHKVWRMLRGGGDTMSPTTCWNSGGPLCNRHVVFEPFWCWVSHNLKTIAPLIKLPPAPSSASMVQEQNETRAEPNRIFSATTQHAPLTLLSDIVSLLKHLWAICRHSKVIWDNRTIWEILCDGYDGWTRIKKVILWNPLACRSGSKKARSKLYKIVATILINHTYVLRVCIRIWSYGIFSRFSSYYC